MNFVILESLRQFLIIARSQIWEKITLLACDTHVPVAAGHVNGEGEEAVGPRELAGAAMCKEKKKDWLVSRKLIKPLQVILRMLSLIGAVPFTLQRRGKATRGPFGFGAVQTFKYSVVATVNVMLMCALITYSSRLFGGLEQSKQFGKDLGFGETDQLAKSISNSWVALMIFPIAASFYGMSKKFNGIFSDIASLKTCKPGAEDLESMKKWIYGNLFLYVLILSYTLGASFLSGFLVMPEFSLRARWAFGSLYSLSIVTTWMGPTVMSAHFMFAYTSHFLIGCFKAWSRCISDPTRDMTFVHLIHSKPPECDPREQQAARKQLLPIENVVLEGIKLTKLVDQFNLASGWMAFFEIGTCFISEIFLYFFLMSAIDLIHNYKLAVFLHVLTFSGAAIFILLRKLNLHLRYVAFARTFQRFLTVSIPASALRSWSTR